MHHFNIQTGDSIPFSAEYENKSVKIFEATSICSQFQTRIGYPRGVRTRSILQLERAGKLSNFALGP